MPPKVGQRATIDDAKKAGMGEMKGKYEVGSKKAKGSITGGKTAKGRESAKHTEVK